MCARAAILRCGARVNEIKYVPLYLLSKCVTFVIEVSVYIVQYSWRFSEFSLHVRIHAFVYRLVSSLGKRPTFQVYFEVFDMLDSNKN